MDKKYLLIPLVILVGVIVFSLNQNRSHNIFIDLAPDGAEIVLDNKGVIKGGGHRLPIGDHIITAKLDGFSEYTKKFSIADNEVTRLDVLLNPVSEEGYEYLRKHPQEQLHRESLGGKAFNQKAGSLAKNNPIIRELPFIDLLYRIDYGKSQRYPNNPSRAAIYITLYNADAQNSALDWIRFKGYDPEKLEIIYSVVDSSPGE